MKKRFVIIHYNTPLLTECLVRSINHFIKDAIIYIFDNSDKDPFTAFYDNVLILDNTQGQIIDFDKWLEKYPNRNRSNGRDNRWGSAKHCYSVEKCMEIIHEPFVLLDSDVLLKQDCSDLFNDDYIYCGEVITQPKSTVKRVLPFICFINTVKCKENNVHYFDENYMHGLCCNNKNKFSDRYDTGGAFFIHSENFQHKDIKWEDYVVHYGSGSWNKKGLIHSMSPTVWVNHYKEYWSMEKNKKVVYTCITGGYDGLITPSYITSGFDYVCFTDDETLTSEIWDIRPLPNETEGLSQVKKQRYVKLTPHKHLSEYDISVWVDGNVDVKGDLNKFLEETLKDDCSVYVPQHPTRNCIYDEASAVIRMRKDKQENVKPQIDRYKTEGFPKKYGLLQSNIMIRKHNEKDCIRLMETWFEELKDGSHRDQLSFNYACWKNDDVKIIYLDKNIWKSNWFKWNCTHAKKKVFNQKSVNTNPIKQIKEEKKTDKDILVKIENVKKKIKLHPTELYTY